MTGQDIPAGTGYTVEESDNAGYTVTSSGTTGTIENGVTAAANFHNYKSGPVYDVDEPAKPTEPTKPITPAKPSKPISSIDGSPNTGDETNPALWLALMSVSGIGIISMLAAFRLRRKGKM